MNCLLKACAVLSLSACTSGLAQPDVPAVIDRSTPESRAELTQAISSALNGAPVTLADDALTQDSLLIIESAHPRAGYRGRLGRKDFSTPEHFRLVKTGTHCALVYERTGARTTLASTTCRPK